MIDFRDAFGKCKSDAYWPWDDQNGLFDIQHGFT